MIYELLTKHKSHLTALRMGLDQSTLTSFPAKYSLTPVISFFKFGLREWKKSSIKREITLNSQKHDVVTYIRNRKPILLKCQER